ncbi:hypothetical protein CBM2587_A10260 [Cupriavidus taiwanensis]|uniref:Glycosyltransferase family 28 N-terminal domain-containing protein n=1 Tax=Cupriavidus taiwanensis TaxID=164546 RepID=A0A375BC47_9BURK|nr:hypothetical protein CBM2587_A10260 [Cupriavidus taiwanensis]
MRLTLITFGTQGDCRPIVALALGLREAGHDVQMLGERSAAPLALEHGIPFAPMAGDIQQTLAPGGALHKLMTEGGNVAEATRAFGRIAEDNTEAWMAQLAGAARDADAIVFSGLTAYVALSVGEQLGKPVIGAGMFPISPTRAFPSALLPPVRMPGWANRASHHLINFVLWRMFRKATNAARSRLFGVPARKGDVGGVSDAVCDVASPGAAPGGLAWRLAGDRRLDPAATAGLAAGRAAARLPGRGRGAALYRFRQHGGL